MAEICIRQVVTGNCANVKGAAFVLQVLGICEKLGWWSVCVMPWERDIFFFNMIKFLWKDFFRLLYKPLINFGGNINSYIMMDVFF